MLAAIALLHPAADDQRAEDQDVKRSRAVFSTSVTGSKLALISQHASGLLVRLASAG